MGLFATKSNRKRTRQIPQTHQHDDPLPASDRGSRFTVGTDGQSFPQPLLSTFNSVSRTYITDITFQEPVGSMKTICACLKSFPAAIKSPIISFDTQSTKNTRTPPTSTKNTNSMGTYAIHTVTAWSRRTARQPSPITTVTSTERPLYLPPTLKIRPGVFI